MDGIEVGLGGSVRICQDLSGSSHAEDLASGDLFKHVFGLGLDTLTISFSPLGSSTKKQRRDSSNLRMIYVERADAHFYMRICVCMCMRMRMRICNVHAHARWQGPHPPYELEKRSKHTRQREVGREVHADADRHSRRQEVS